MFYLWKRRARKYNCIRKKTKEVKCFKFGEIGHYSNKCIKKKVNKIKIYHSKKLDERIIRINNRPYRAIFDTGATGNIICSGLLKCSKNTKIHKSKIREYKLINGTNIKQWVGKSCI
ncbi:hypothetical protein H312_03402 [Anncaliia algerae PRA339]|uniref:CCHC-type domain-containing protein n=1 Tax=Anncaliia algerae PRA339 TaxID=1288291 RepID=A0A059EWU3_9MICR|nr:hypothetical protein H312_03402 [Anncaliia algerae PRA339]